MSQETSAERGTTRIALLFPVTIRPFTKSPALSDSSGFGTSVFTFTVRLASSATGLMNETRPVNSRPGNASLEKANGWPGFSSAMRADGTLAVSSRSRLSTMRNIGGGFPMFSTKSPTLTFRVATTPSIGARRTAFVLRVSAIASWAFAAASPARAASSAVFASSSPCCVASPACLSLALRSSSRAARCTPTSAWSAAARAAATAASASRVSRRASGVPAFTRTHCVT